MGVSCVWVLGHSEGGLSALVAARQGASICGLLLVSTPGRRLGDILREQIAANPANGPVRDQAESIIAQLEAGKRVEAKAVHPALLPLFRSEVQGFLISVLTIDPAKLIADYRGPVLILQGLRDIQVGLVDAKRLHQARPDAKMALLPHANHVLKSVVSDDRTANVAAYKDAGRPLAERVVETLAAFIRAENKVR
jgi:pimeloyl-ACP methyl ester carboxylesterase